jgi:hypothetical protein
MGYHRAGFDVVGVDIEPQPHYPFEFHQGDAMTWPLDGFDAVHASPPCQRWSNTGTTRAIGDEHPDLLGPTQERFATLDIPWVIENIPLAPMAESFVLCGMTFGLPIVRHRRFETSMGFMFVPSACPQSKWRSAGGGHPGTYPYAQKSWEKAWREHVIPVVWPWMTLREAGLAIPPAYTEWIGRRLIEAIDQERVA